MICRAVIAIFWHVRYLSIWHILNYVQHLIELFHMYPTSIATKNVPKIVDIGTCYKLVALLLAKKILLCAFSKSQTKLLLEMCNYC